MENKQISKVVDPDNVPEILAVGPFNCSYSGGLATLIFTHARLDVGPLFQSIPAMEQVAVVRARIVLPVENLRGLRDGITQLLAGADAQQTAAHSGSAH